MRRAIGSIVAGCVLAALLWAPPAPAAKRRVPVKVGLSSVDRPSILRAGALSVRVAARRGTRVRVSAPGVARSRTLRFRRDGRARSGCA